MSNLSGIISEVVESVPNEKGLRDVVFLMHGNEVNSSTVFREETGRTITATGGVSIDRSNSVFGKGSIYFDGLGSYLETAITPSLNLGSEDFTIEFWIYPEPPAANSLNVILDYRPDSRSGNFLTLQYLSTGIFRITYQGNNRLSLKALNFNVWNHVVLQRRNNLAYLFINGSKDRDGILMQVNFLSTANRLLIGSGAFSRQGENIEGNLEDLRITKGIAIYSGNFHPPTEPYPNPIEDHEVVLSLDADDLIEDSWTGNRVSLEGTASISSAESIDGAGAGSFFFDGSNGGQVIVDNNNQELINWFKENYTIEFWIYPLSFFTGNNSVNVIFFNANWVSGANFDGVRVEFFQGSFRFVLVQINPTIAQVLTYSSSNFIINKWQHISIVVNDNSTINIYLDGKLIQPSSGSSNRSVFKTVVFNSDSYIGNQNYNFNGQAGEFHGYINNLVITKSVKYLTNFQPPNKHRYVRGLTDFVDYSSQTTPIGLITPSVPVRGLVNYWKLDEASGTRGDSFGADDFIDNNLVGSQAGLISNEATFNGSDQWLSNSSFTTPSNSFSVCGWVTINSFTSDYATFIAKYGPSGNNGWGIYIRNDGLIEAYVSANGNTRTFTSAINSIPLNTRVFISYVFNSVTTIASIYIDGAFDNSSLTGYTSIFNSATDLVIGVNFSGSRDTNYLDGAVDEVSIYNKVLTKREIDILYNQGNGLTI